MRRRAAGAFLMREYMAGAQDLTITDTASDMVRRIWEGVGGETCQLACIGWVRVFRPLRSSRPPIARRQRASRCAKRVLPGCRTRSAVAASRGAGGSVRIERASFGPRS